MAIRLLDMYEILPMSYVDCRCAYLNRTVYVSTRTSIIWASSNVEFRRQLYTEWGIWPW